MTENNRIPFHPAFRLVTARENQDGYITQQIVMAVAGLSLAVSGPVLPMPAIICLIFFVGGSIVASRAIMDVLIGPLFDDYNTIFNRCIKKWGSDDLEFFYFELQILKYKGIGLCVVGLTLALGQFELSWNPLVHFFVFILGFTIALRAFLYLWVEWSMAKDEII